MSNPKRHCEDCGCELEEDEESYCEDCLYKDDEDEYEDEEYEE